MSAKDREFLQGWKTAAFTISQRIQETGRIPAEHATRLSAIRPSGVLRNMSRLSRGYYAGMRAAVGMAS